MTILLDGIKKNFHIFKKKKYRYQKKKCEICDKQKNIIFQNLGKTGNSPGSYGYLPVSICSNCGHKFLSPRLSNKFYKNFYLEEYGKIPFKKKTPSKKYINLQKQRGNKVYNFFSKKIKKSIKPKILDHGAATGLALLPWKKNNWETYGVEPHIESVKIAKQLGLKVVQGYGENLKFRNTFFDLIISLGSFEHAYDINSTFREFRRVLKKNGILILRWRSDKFTGSPLEYYNFITYRYFTNNSLKNLLSKHGFFIKEHINNKIEGYDTYEYIYAVKKNKLKLVIEKNTLKKIINYHKKYYREYYKLCNKIKNKSFKKFRDKMRFVKKNKIGTMNIGKTNSINRVFKDSINFLNAVKKFNINLNLKKK